MDNKRGRYRKCPKLLNYDVYKYVAEQSSLTQGQVRECFATYYNLLMAIASDDSRPKDLLIALPKIGYIEFKEKKGKKKGTIKNCFVNNKRIDRQSIYIEEDRPDYERLFLRVADKVQKEVRRTSEQKNIRMQNYNEEFLEIKRQQEEKYRNKRNAEENQN